MAKDAFGNSSTHRGMQKAVKAITGKKKRSMKRTVKDVESIRY